MELIMTKEEFERNMKALNEPGNKSIASILKKLEERDALVIDRDHGVITITEHGVAVLLFGTALGVE